MKALTIKMDGERIAVREKFFVYTPLTTLTREWQIAKNPPGVDILNITGKLLTVKAFTQAV